MESLDTIFTGAAQERLKKTRDNHLAKIFDKYAQSSEQSAYDNRVQVIDQESRTALMSMNLPKFSQDLIKTYKVDKNSQNQSKSEKLAEQFDSMKLNDTQQKQSENKDQQQPMEQDLKQKLLQEMTQAANSGVTQSQETNLNGQTEEDMEDFLDDLL